MNNQKHEFNCPMCNNEILLSNTIANKSHLTLKERSREKKQEQKIQEEIGNKKNKELKIYRWMTVDEYCELSSDILQNNELFNGLGRVKGLVCCDSMI